MRWYQLRAKAYLLDPYVKVETKIVLQLIFGLFSLFDINYNPLFLSQTKNILKTDLPTGRTSLSYAPQNNQPVILELYHLYVPNWDKGSYKFIWFSRNP